MLRYIFPKWLKPPSRKETIHRPRFVHNNERIQYEEIALVQYKQIVGVNRPQRAKLCYTEMKRRAETIVEKLGSKCRKLASRTSARQMVLYWTGQKPIEISFPDILHLYAEICEGKNKNFLLINF